MAIDVVVKERSNTTEKQPMRVGWFRGRIVAINPSLRELNELLDTNYAEQREQKNRDDQGHLQTVLEMYLQDVKTEEIYRTPLRIVLVDKPYVTKNTGKHRFIDTKGNPSFAVDSEDNVPQFMKDNGVWMARQGEAQLYELMRAYLTNVNWKETKKFVLDWEALMEGDVDELRDIVTGPMAGDAVFMMQVESYTKEGENKQKQSIYPFKFMPGYYATKLTLGGYTMASAKKLHESIKSSTTKFSDFKPYEHYVADMYAANTNEFSFRPIHLFDPESSENKVEQGSFLNNHGDDDIF